MAVLSFVAGPVAAQTPTVVNDLTFGNILSGVPKAVSKHTAGAAAEFTVTGTAGAEITIDFNLPPYLISGSNTVQLIFTDVDCAMDSSASPDQSSPGYNDRNPWATITYRLGSSGLTIWLGGLVMPTRAVSAGSYSSPLVLTVEYTGN